MRLIDADELLKKIPTEEVVARMTVAYMPTVDIVKHGRWIDRDVLDTDEASEVVDEWQVAKCSVCGVHFTAPYLYHFDDYNYCPNCGAKMDEVSE